MLEFASILLILSILENQEKYVDSTIDSYHKIRQETVILKEEFKTASDKRKKIIIQKMEAIKARLRKIKQYDRTRKYDN